MVPQTLKRHSLSGTVNSHLRTQLLSFRVPLGNSLEWHPTSTLKYLSWFWRGQSLSGLISITAYTAGVCQGTQKDLMPEDLYQKDFRVGHPKICHFGVKIILNWRQLKMNRYKKSVLPCPFSALKQGINFPLWRWHEFPLSPIPGGGTWPLSLKTERTEKHLQEQTLLK